VTVQLELDAIPHRPPFLFVDEIVAVEEGRIATKKFVDPASDFFQGHYPDQPVMPGVLLCESCFQAGALLIAHILGAHEPRRGVPVLTRITDARFKRIVRPGDTLDIEATLDQELDGAYFMTGRCNVDGMLAVRLAFACMLARAEDRKS
jgi:3-hydroxyacyl-[acyl-carrier-protein] dehydratase